MVDAIGHHTASFETARPDDWEALNKLKGAFNRFDENRSETIDREEFEHLLDEIGAEMTDEQIAVGFAQIDTDGSGEIEFSEVVDWWKQLKKVCAAPE